MRWYIRLVFGTRRGWKHLAVNGLAAFGLISALIEFYLALTVPTQPVLRPILWFSIIGLVSFVYGVIRAWPQKTIRRDFGRPDMSITITVGDLLDSKGQIVVGFSDTFDTQIINGVISPTSLQGQLLERVYEGNVERLDRDIESALVDIKPSGSETRPAKKFGKLSRYPIGTVAVLRTDANTIYAVAYSSMNNNLVAKSTVHALWYSLGQLWDAVYKNGQRQQVKMPLVGGELARINCLDKESLLKMALLSFTSRSREELICKDFTIVIHPKDVEKINMLEVESFLHSL